MPRPAARSVQRVLALTLLLTSALPAQPAQPAWPAPLPPAALREDFDVLRRALAEAHGGYDRFAPRAEVDRRIEAHRARLDHPMDAAAFATILEEALAELRDGHARLELDSLTAAALAGAPLLPLRVALEGERLVVMSNETPDDSTIAPGMELLRVNGRDVAEIVARLLPGVSGDGFIETGRRAVLARELPRRLWLHGVRGDSFALVARDARGRTVRATLPGVPERERAGARNPVNARLRDALARLEAPPGNVSLELFGDSAARLRVRAFGGEDFPARLDSAFRTLRERRTPGLVLDLRGNGGGVDEYGALLISHFLAEPFRYFDRIRVATVAPSFATWKASTFEDLRAGTAPDPAGGFLVAPSLHPGVGEQRAATEPYRGRLVVLIDGGSFSTTADVAAQLRSRGRATFVGEETGGGYDGNTSGLNALVVLPHSRLRTKVMMYGYWNAVRPAAQPGRGTIPEHVVPRPVADLLEGNDRALARALALLAASAAR